jgi:protoporphyrinogen oxidase
LSSHRPASSVVILGAGPAGLTAAYELSRQGVRCTVIEQDSMVGGLARTVEYKGNLFDIGGHRFYTKVAMVEQMWKQVLGEDLLVRQRLSRIFYRGKFFQYPLEPLNALKGLGPVETLHCIASYVKAHVAPRAREDDFESWVTNRFGSRLFEVFFKSYTEKVWGISCREIRAEWAAQRIRGLSLFAAIQDALGWRRRRAIKTLTREFYYPRRGPGMMWNRLREIVEQAGVEVVLNAPVEQVRWEGSRIASVQAGGRVYRADQFISSIPIRVLIEKLAPAAPEPLREAGADFHYRDFLTIGLIVRGANLFPDHWIYVHDPDVTVGRIQNYSNWSSEMTADPATTCLGMEYFAQEGDALWTMADEDLIAKAQREITHLGLVQPGAFLDAKVVRMPKAYPVYDTSYQRGLATVRRYLDKVENLQLIGRNGMHRYNNQDHSMLTGIFAARNVLGARYDLWALNADPDYLEEGSAVTQAELQALEDTQPRSPDAISARAVGTP